jgi:PIN domain nuclease of toxin-antitoxin system
MAELPAGCINVDLEIAQRAAAMDLMAHKDGLSLGDRLCRATASRGKRPVLTADRAGLEVAEALGMEVRLFG